MPDKLLTAFNTWRRNLLMNVIDINGDSRGAQAWVSTAGLPANRPIGLAATHFLNWANKLTGNRMTLGNCFAFSGDRSDQYIAKYKTRRLASNSGFSLWNFPCVNDIAQAAAGYTDTISGIAVTTANVALVAFNNLRAEWELDLAAGKKVILLTEPGATNLAVDQVKAVHEFNTRMRCYAEGRPGIILFDFTAILWAPSQSPTLIRMKTGYLQPSDPTHYSSLGAYAVGKVFADWLKTVLPARDKAVVSAHDSYINNPLQIVRNPLFLTATGGTTGANMTVSSGTVPGNMALSATAAASVAITQADAVSGDAASGKAVTLAITAGAAATVVKFAADSPATSYWAVDSLIEAGVEVDVAANAGGAHVYFDTQINTNAGSKDAWDMYATRAQGAGPVEAYSISLKSEVETPIAGSATTGYIAPAMFVALDANATCTVMVKRTWGYLRYPAPAW